MRPSDTKRARTPARLLTFQDTISFCLCQEETVLHAIGKLANTILLELRLNVMSKIHIRYARELTEQDPSESAPSTKHWPACMTHYMSIVDSRLVLSHDLSNPFNFFNRKLWIPRQKDDMLSAESSSGSLLFSRGRLNHSHPIASRRIKPLVNHSLD